MLNKIKKAPTAIENADSKPRTFFAHVLKPALQLVRTMVDANLHSSVEFNGIDIFPLMEIFINPEIISSVIFTSALPPLSSLISTFQFSTIL